jgi:putative membrane protein
MQYLLNKRLEVGMTEQEKQDTNEFIDTQVKSIPKLTLMAKFKHIFSTFQPPEIVDDEPKDANALAEIRTALAVKRNLMAADRTLMAWVRTALSMISFGFTIYKILQGFQLSGGDNVIETNQFDPQTIGLILIGLGLFSVVLGAIEYRATLIDLRHLQRVPFIRPAFILAMVMASMCILMFLSIIAKVL